MTNRLWLQSEVAERLRTSEAAVKRMRLAGQLGYYPGPPILISEEQLLEYLRARERKAKPNAVTSREEQDLKRIRAYWKKRKEREAEKERQAQTLEQAKTRMPSEKTNTVALTLGPEKKSSR